MTSARRPLPAALPSLLRIALLSVLLFPAACSGIEKYGEAANYEIISQHKIPVHMPANAPYISQQFVVAADTRQKTHLGIDIWARKGYPIIAAAPGTVIRSFHEPVYGNRILISHGTGPDGKRIATVYKHLDARHVEEGATVARGQQIGTMGSTGALAALIHLHFEVQKYSRKTGEEYLDPQLFWKDGPGRVTCFDGPLQDTPGKLVTTYPVPCRE